jgi:hypothetical protein
MPPAPSLQLQLFGFLASANGETAVYSLAVVALAFILCLSLRRRR